jgi:hypothetical protein
VYASLSENAHQRSLLEQIKREIASTPTIFFIGVIVTVCYLSAFYYLLRTGYDNAMGVKFLSLNPENGVCDTIPIRYTTNILVDKHGHWETSSLFRSEEALFEVSFLSYEADDKTWVKDMAKLNAAIQTEMSHLRSTSDLPRKVLHLTSWRSTVPATINGTMRVWFNAKTKNIFGNRCQPKDVRKDKISTFFNMHRYPRLPVGCGNGSTRRSMLSERFLESR